MLSLKEGRRDKPQNLWQVQPTLPNHPNLLLTSEIRLQLELWTPNRKNLEPVPWIINIIYIYMYIYIIIQDIQEKFTPPWKLAACKPASRAKVICFSARCTRSPGQEGSRSKASFKKCSFGTDFPPRPPVISKTPGPTVWTFEHSTWNLQNLTSHWGALELDNMFCSALWFFSRARFDSPYISNVTWHFWLNQRLNQNYIGDW